MITIIAAIAKNNVIGRENDLPWHLPEDLKRFKRLTTGHTVLMGRKTFESIMDRIGKPLPNRTNLVITRQADYPVPNECHVHNSIESAISEHSNEHIFIIGGASIYKMSMDLADELQITHLDQEYEGDARFPDIDPDLWQITEEDQHDGYRFVTYKRK